MEGVRGFIQSPGGKIVGSIASLAALCLGIYVVRTSIRSETPESAFTTMFIDTETGKPFSHVNKEGESTPILAPSGKNTGYPAEACYWTADGQVKTEPTWVVVRQTMGKTGPTFCPDCGRLVVGHNPPAEAGRRPPPTQKEYAARYGYSPLSSGDARQ
jgi:hypothetical protein